MSEKNDDGLPSRKPPHMRFRLDPPHGDTLYWVAQARVPGDSRTEHIAASREWFWRGQVPAERATASPVSLEGDK